MREIGFAHPYFKLGNPIFPTTRGKSWINKIEPDETVLIMTKNARYEATVLSVRLWKIKDLSISFIKIDGSYPPEPLIKNHKQYIALLNSFRPFHKINPFEEDVVVIWLMK